jgi:hypothetical protein
MTAIKPSSPVAAPGSPKKVPKIRKQFEQRQKIAKAIVKEITAEFDPKSIENHVAVNAQILLTGIRRNIKSLGAHPIAIVAKRSVNKGISLKPKVAPVAKPKTRKEVSKALNAEILKLAGSKPSEVKVKRQIAPIKDLVNTEVSFCMVLNYRLSRRLFCHKSPRDHLSRLDHQQRLPLLNLHHQRRLPQ